MVAAFSFYLFATLLLGAAVGVIFSKNPVHSVLFLILAFFNGAALFVLLGAEFLAMLLVIVYVGAVAVLFLFVVMMLEIAPQKSTRLSWHERGLRLKKGSKELGRFALFFIPFWGVLMYGIGVVGALLQGGGLSSFLVQEGGVVWSLISLGKGVDKTLSLMTLSVALALITFFLALQGARRFSGVNLLEAGRHFFSALPMSFFVGLLLIGECVYVSLSWSSSSYYQQVGSAPMPPSDLMTNTQSLAGLIYRYYAYVFEASGLILLVAMIGAIVLTLRQKTTMRRQDISVQISRRPEETLELTKPEIGEGVPHV